MTPKAGHDLREKPKKRHLQDDNKKSGSPGKNQQLTQEIPPQSPHTGAEFVTQRAEKPR